MDEEAASRPAVLSPFLPSQAATIATFLAMFDCEPLGPEDVLLDIGCGDGRVLVAAVLATGCRGVGVDVSPDCIAAAQRMTDEEAALRPGDSGLSGRLTWICEDLAQRPQLLVDIARDHGATVAFLYIYPSLLEVLRPSLEELSRTAVRRPAGHLKEAGSKVDRADPPVTPARADGTIGASTTARRERGAVKIFTAGYHMDGWSASVVSVAPSDPAAGPNASEVEIRLLEQIFA
mmetsp:Transcript_65628/g.148105  ORF Transcript_65628/g.148105 Transcript_65628/m.148105 type:complete len:234 (+) Transcript_65628:245-946(+)